MQPAKKRKAEGSAPASGRKQKKRTAGVASCAPVLAASVREGLGFTQLELPPGQAAVFCGRGRVHVTDGCLEVNGLLLPAGAPAVDLMADERVGGGLQLLAVAAEGQLTRAVVESTGAAQQQPEAQQAGSSQGSDQDATQHAGYVVALASASDAPHCWPIQDDWKQAASAIASAAMAPGAPHLVAAVCGSKGVGKSSFARVLVNALLNSCSTVAFLDTDCGQPEFTTPGLVSLHVLQQPIMGPPHMHMQAPLRAHFQGDTSPQTDPLLYLQAVQSLLSRYRQLAGNGSSALPPLVVNMHGWITGLGLDLMVELLRSLQPTHVVELQSKGVRKNLPPGHFWAEDSYTAAATQLLQLPGVGAGADAALTATAAAVEGGSPIASGGEGVASYVSPQSSKLSDISGKTHKATTAVESRTLQWLAWARRVVAAAGAAAADDAADSTSSANEQTASDTAAALAAACPYEVYLSDVRLLLSQSGQLPACEVAYALNGMLVGLLVSDDGAVQQQQQQQQRMALPQLQQPPVQPLECLGLGLVRAVDAKRGVLYLLTDVPEEQLQSVTTLQLGRLELPRALVQTPNLAPPYSALFALNSAAAGAGVIKSRNNLLRASLLPG